MQVSRSISSAGRAKKSRDRYGTSESSLAHAGVNVNRRPFVVRRSAGDNASSTATQTVTLLNTRDEFKAMIESNKDKILLVDYYTTW
jgi:hypothetical protein